MDENSPDTNEMFVAAVAQMNEQRRLEEDTLLSECREHWDSGKHLPNDLLKRFGWSGKGSSWLKNYHPYFPTYEAMEQVETAFKMLVQARASLIELYGHYHAALMYDGFELSDEVAWRTTHEVFKFVFAAAALVQAYRRFLGHVPASEERL